MPDIQKHIGISGEVLIITYRIYRNIDKIQNIHVLIGIYRIYSCKLSIYIEYHSLSIYTKTYRQNTKLTKLEHYNKSEHAETT